MTAKQYLCGREGAFIKQNAKGRNFKLKNLIAKAGEFFGK